MANKKIQHMIKSLGLDPRVPYKLDGKGNIILPQSLVTKPIKETEIFMEQVDDTIKLGNSIDNVGVLSEELESITINSTTLPEIIESTLPEPIKKIPKKNNIKKVNSTTSSNN